MTTVGSTTTTSSIGGTYGLSGSGVDVDSIVKKLMAGQQAVEDSLTQKQTILQWQKSAYNTVYDDLNSFKTSTVFNFKLQATLSPNKVTSSNTLVATATANAGAADVNHSLVVAQLASGVNLTSTASISTSNTLGTLAQQFGMTSTDPFNITIKNGSSTSQPITINPTTDTINDVVSKINSAGVNVQASYDSTLDRFFLTTTNTGASSGISFVGSDQAGLNFLGGTLKLNGGLLRTLPVLAPIQASLLLVKMLHFNWTGWG
ncbi:flagellar cap protein FliD N-terminal domain-containing protein [Desulfosporosinus sp. SB140]|uniref:flagellar cap protein FliD N-terminal domain-containing protein n=1 Tax=Desulfosporosinus paludis TaxID=3115649 RepID=UPI00388E8CEA